MEHIKEIVTKAVIGKGKKKSNNVFNINTDFNPNTVLGCWIINHKFSGNNQNGKVVVNGSYDVNVWYSYDNDTKTSVTTTTYDYEESMKINLRENSYLSNNSEIIVKALSQPTVSSVEIKDNVVIVSISKELGIEIVGDAKVKVSAIMGEDDYEEIIDEEEVIEEIKEEVKEEYL